MGPEGSTKGLSILLQGPFKEFDTATPVRWLGRNIFQLGWA